MTDIDYAAARALCDAAAPGPWLADPGGCYITNWNGDNWPKPEFTIYDEGGHSPADAAFIAAARDLVPALLDEVDGLTRQADELGDIVRRDTETIARLTAERDEARAALARVEALCDRWELRTTASPAAMNADDAIRAGYAGHVRAALRGDQP